MSEIEDKIEKLKEDNLNLRFDKVEKELQDLNKLLTDYIKDQKESNKSNADLIKEISDRLLLVEEKGRNCPIGEYRDNVKKLATETKFIRQIFATPAIGLILLTIWVIIVFVLLAAFGPDSILKLISIIR